MPKLPHFKSLLCDLKVTEQYLSVINLLFLFAYLSCTGKKSEDKDVNKYYFYFFQLIHISEFSLINMCLFYKSKISSFKTKT